MEKTAAAAVAGKSQNSMQFVIIGIVVILVAVGAYFAVIAPMQRSATAVTTITCNSPYILVGNSCCLDTNGNGICDNQEQRPAEQNATNQIVQEESTTLVCAASRSNEVRGEWLNSQYNIHLLARPDNTYEFTFSGQTHNGNYKIDFGNWMHLYEGGAEIYSFNVCFVGSKLKLQAHEGGFYPEMNRVG